MVVILIISYDSQWATLREMPTKGCRFNTREPFLAVGSGSTNQRTPVFQRFLEHQEDQDYQERREDLRLQEGQLVLEVQEHQEVPLILLVLGVRVVQELQVPQVVQVFREQFHPDLLLLLVQDFQGIRVVQVVREVQVAPCCHHRPVYRVPREGRGNPSVRGLRRVQVVQAGIRNRIL